MNARPEPQNGKTLNVKCKSQPVVDEGSGLLLHFAVLNFSVFRFMRNCQENLTLKTEPDQNEFGSFVYAKIK